MSVTPDAQRNREIVRRIYEAAFADDANDFTGAIHDDFEESVPPILTWGGVHRGPVAFMTTVLPRLAAAVVFPSMQLVSRSADGDRVAALLSARSVSGAELWIAEHWTMRDGKAFHLMVFYHDTTPLTGASKSTGATVH